MYSCFALGVVGFSGYICMDLALVLLVVMLLCAFAVGL